MANAKAKIQQGLIIIFFLLFPLGQILRTEILVGNYTITVQPIDLVVTLIVIFGFVFERKLLRVFYLLIFTFLIAGLAITKLDIFRGGFYLMRLLVYLLLPFTLLKQKSLLAKGLIVITLATVLFSWIQYFAFPDLTSLKLLGWDDHYFRLVGTFLDPGFTAMILVLGAIIMFYKYLKNHDFLTLFIFIIISVTIAFTYSRAGYLAYLSGITTLLYLNKALKKLFILIPAFLIIIFLLPRPGGTGVQLERSYSIDLRIQNYEQTLKVWKTSPLFGVGFNHLCSVRQNMFGDDPVSHACSGSDSSLLMILATTGVVGIFVLLGIFKKIHPTNQILIASICALAINSLFINSLFYPWVMGWMGMLVATTSNSEE